MPDALVPAILSDLLSPGRVARLAKDGIWSALPEGQDAGRYDGRASAYDAVVGSRLYNRLVWGSSPAAYAAFAERAVQSDRLPLLDAGCGSLVFTADIYARARRPLVLVDRSLGMLGAAAVRLRRRRREGAPETIFLQADVLDLPFRPECFGTVLSMGMLHLFDDAEGFVGALRRVLAPDGHLFLTSLVTSRRIGRTYLAMLHRAGEVALPRTHRQLVEAIQGSRPGPPGRIDSYLQGSMAFLTVGADPPKVVGRSL